MKRHSLTLGVVVACALAGGCASTPVPEAQVASTQEAVQSARQAGADRVPEANKHLTMAEDQLAKARTHISKGDNDDALPLLTRAEYDAALAAALSREAQQKAATEAVIVRVQSVSAPMKQPSGR